MPRDEVKIRLEGDKDLVNVLEAFKPAARRRIVRPPITKGVRLVVRAAKQKVPKETGTLKRSLGFVVRTYPSGTVAGIAGPRKGIVDEETGRNPRFYAHLVEFGTAPHLVSSSIGPTGERIDVVHPGSPPKPFIRPAWDGSIPEINRLMEMGIRQGVAKEIARKVKRSLTR